MEKDESKPKRIQRRRTKGWKMPEGAVYVGRPSRFGNPFSHAERFAGIEFSLRCFRMAIDGIWDPSKLKDMPPGPFHVACQDFSEWIKGFKLASPREDIRSNLRGRDLACWCKLCDKHRNGKPLNEPCADCSPCHADVLLDISNSSQ